MQRPYLVEQEGKPVRNVCTVIKIGQSVSPSPFAISIGGEISESTRLLATGFRFFCGETNIDPTKRTNGLSRQK